MNFPSLAGLSLLPAPGNTAIAVSPHWTCDHAIVIDRGLVDLASDDGEDDGGEFEVVFEPDFSLDEDQDDADDDGGGPFGRLDRDEEDEEDDWPP